MTVTNFDPLNIDLLCKYLEVCLQILFTTVYFLFISCTACLFRFLSFFFLLLVCSHAEWCLTPRTREENEKHWATKSPVLCHKNKKCELCLGYVGELLIIFTGIVRLLFLRVKITGHGWNLSLLSTYNSSSTHYLEETAHVKKGLFSTSPGLWTKMYIQVLNISNSDWLCHIVIFFWFGGSAGVHLPCHVLVRKPKAGRAAQNSSWAIFGGGVGSLTTASLETNHNSFRWRKLAAKKNALRSVWCPPALLHACLEGRGVKCSFLMAPR